MEEATGLVDIREDKTSGDGILILIEIMIVLLETGHYDRKINAISSAGVI